MSKSIQRNGGLHTMICNSGGRGQPVLRADPRRCAGVAESVDAKDLKSFA
ncbi:protein of unknown function [Azospirillum baldaniorum]|uniref:Uncharacterized protein n=1 Tax=Azospirillum baldaniorum TaxID=1064539 RepID=A0A9P1JPE9_9PROT|nr:protein of unknown function [Azospirillum baldaniorum]